VNLLLGYRKKKKKLKRNKHQKAKRYLVKKTTDYGMPLTCK